MKLLDWMHNKFRHNSIEPFKDFSIGNPCICLTAQATIDDEGLYSKGSTGSRYGSNNVKSYSQLEAIDSVEETLDEEISAVSEFFHGFLTIGTLGLEPIISEEPETPTFAMASENIDERQIEVTADDLKLVKYELEKFLEAEYKEDFVDESSGRNSYVSTITLSGLKVEGAEVETLICPLQGYLFGSSIELPEKISEVKKEKVSLAELFQRTKMTNENPGEKSDEEMEIQQAKKRTKKSAMPFVKKMLKRLQVSSKSSTGDEAADSFSAKKKLIKVLRMFHRKVHPESPVSGKDSPKSRNAPHYDGNNAADLMHPNEVKKRFRYKTNLDLSQYDMNKGHWIKTDADYLVLEL